MSAFLGWMRLGIMGYPTSECTVDGAVVECERAGVVGMVCMRD